MTFNNITELYNALLDSISKEKSGTNVFGNEITVVVPNQNVGALLKTKLADKQGVVTRTAFVTKEQFILSKISAYKDDYLGFMNKYLRYHILNLLNSNRISSNLNFYYINDSIKMYNYAKDIEKHFMHYQYNNHKILKSFSNHNLDYEIKTPFELQAFIYQSIKDKGFITLNEAVNKVLGDYKTIYFIKDQKDNKLFEMLIKKYSNTKSYQLLLTNHNNQIKLLNNWSKIREMESVWDYITNELETTNLLPGDILVLFPNVNEYITSINYVFGKKIDNFNTYKYSISNYVNEIESYKQFLSQLRQEIDYRFEANKMFDLFVSSSKLKGQNYQKRELDLIKDWINYNAIRSNSKIRTNNDFSWDKGFEQLILGMMMESDGFDYHQNYAAKDISLSEYALFESLYMFIKTINELSNSKYETIEELNDLVSKSLVEFFGNPEIEDGINTKIFNLWIDITNNQLSILDNLPPIKVIFKILEEQVSTFKEQYTILGGINFGTIEDFNLVDAKLKIVCGLDDSSFPLLKTDSILNLDKDKELNQIKAQEQLFKNLVFNNNEIVLSHIGFNEANRKTINRSVFIDLFIKDQIKEINHKLQPFDDVYLLNKDTNYYTYDQRYKTVNELTNKNAFIETVKEEDGIYKNLNDLKRTLKAPVDNWFRNVLKVTFPEDEEVLKNSPLYFLESENKLEESIVKSAVLKDFINPINKELKKTKAKGLVPYDSFGKYYIKAFKEMFDEISDIFNNHDKYELIENLNLIYNEYFLNIEKIYYNKEDDNYILITSSTITKKEVKRDKATIFNFKFMFQNYLLEALLIKLIYNKDVKLIGFDKDGELVEYYKDIFEILNITANDPLEQIDELEEALDNLFLLKDVFETKLYLYDMSNQSNNVIKAREVYYLLRDITNGLFSGENKIVNEFFNNFDRLEKYLSREKTTRKTKLLANDEFSKSDINKTLEIINEIEYKLNRFILGFGSHMYGLKKYNLYFQYLLEDISSVQDFVKKHGLKVLIESFMLSYEIMSNANFNLYAEED